MKLIDNIELLKKSKISIMQSWISNEEVLKVLQRYDIQKELFIKNYAFGIFDYYVGIVENKNDIGDCPIIEKLLIFLQYKDIGTSELFVICAGFKNALIEFLYNNDLNILEIQNEIVYIYERNFEGVLLKYSQKVSDINKTLDISEELIDNNIIISTTDLKGIITSVSTAFCEISGYTKDELIGQPHSIARHPDTTADIFVDLWTTIKAGNIWHGEIKNLKKDGGAYWVDATVGPEVDSTGDIVGYSAIRHDITYEKEVATQQDIIVEQSKASAMGEMISMIAHQWRQPLQAIAILIQKLPLEKLIDGEISEETLNSVVGSIDEQLSYMSKTIEDFRSFFNPSRDRQKIFASSLVEQARDFLAYSFKVDDINFSVEAKDDMEINVHINEIVQVFINILNNAKEALMEKNIKDKKISVHFYRLNDNIVFEIIDNAGGIPSIIMNKVFEPYFSTKKNKNGTGLGLYMSKTIVEKNAQGILSVKNVEDGASFKVVLPIN
ncbi:MAG: PAS domain S-box protein [Campylobacterota bacterium]|nr:PAS domain S-box protein [Campylobacterota bacterium]